MKKALGHIICAILAVCILSGCIKDDEYFTGKRYSRVMLLYTAAYNNLSSEINSNISDLARGILPVESGDKCVLVFTHNSKNDYDFTTPTQPCLVRLYSDWEGNPHRDTVMFMEPDTRATDPATMTYVLEYVREHYPSDHYGLVYSSHGSGWTPEGYYNSPSSFSSALRRSSSLRDLLDTPEYVNGPKVKSIGASMHDVGGKTVTYETDIVDFANSIPYHLDYIVLDACLMGGIETAYELREKTDKIVFSQAEILSAGFPYSGMTTRLLRGPLDVEGVAEDYFEFYHGSVWKSATVSVVDCRYLEDLKDCCQGLFSKYRAQIAAVDASKVQGFFRMGRSWFYDMEDILVKAGIPDAELADFRGIMDNLITYKSHTDRILDTFDVGAFCGLSMYLPSQGSPYLDSYYRKLAWQKGTGLVN